MWWVWWHPSVDEHSMTEWLMTLFLPAKQFHCMRTIEIIKQSEQARAWFSPATWYQCNPSVVSRNIILAGNMSNKACCYQSSFMCVFIWNWSTRPPPLHHPRTPLEEAKTTWCDGTNLKFTIYIFKSNFKDTVWLLSTVCNHHTHCSVLPKY